MTRHAPIARQAAVALLRGVVERGQPLADLLAASDGPLATLGPADRARAQRLTLATLRRIGPVDAALTPLLRRRPQAAVLAILRLAVTELVMRPDAAHGIVNSAVAMARAQPTTAGAAGFVNAVLRRIAANPPGLGVQQLPDWLRRPLVTHYGAAATAAIEAAHLAGPTLDITLRDSASTRASIKEWAAKLGATTLPTGSLRMEIGQQVSALPGYTEGAWWVQDAAAALPARLLAVQAGERVLDLCAAPGGKTLQLAAAGAQVTALDISAGRMARVTANLARTGLSANTIIADARNWQPADPFPAILLDAPCTATGTIRRHPDLPFVKRPADIAALTTLQAALIDQAVAMLAPGGRLVYCTCSLLPAEGEDQVAAALARHPQLMPDPVDLPGVPAAWHVANGALRTRPDYWADAGGIDGFYIARLRRRDPGTDPATG